MTAVTASGRPAHHVLSVLVENRAGVLARVASLFARRGYNIFSLAVAPTEDERFSRITIVVDVESAPLEQIVKQLFKIISVVRIQELDPRQAVERELLLATVRAEPSQRSQVVELRNDRVEGSLPRERSHVQLVEDVIAQRLGKLAIG